MNNLIKPHLPVSAPIDGELIENEEYSQEEKYAVEKNLGVRRPDGAKKLKVLKPWHVKMVKYHLQGYSNRMISKLIGRGEATICVLLKDPKIVQMINRCLEGYKDEFKALEGKAIDALRTNMDAGGDASLKAASIWFKERERVESSQDSGDGAEDIIGKIFEKVENSTINIQVNKK